MIFFILVYFAIILSQIETIGIDLTVYMDYLIWIKILSL